ncbi:hypothetical protein DID88_009453 [Monilinia fructigena]|uniref:TauD/TfdA-like domain-containing protein n=1 Tax=Monilinia fructigena TaxID=38457 RepID=A0A395IM05_9HELO|nr:hypothetical protein DID88_009453 [Monilinia fructigena]
MAPSVTEPISQTAEQIREKLTPNASETPDKYEGKAHEALNSRQSATPVQVPTPAAQHIHPITNSGRDLGGKDDEISVISSVQAKKLFGRNFGIGNRQSAKTGWHSDITFEPIPSDYALLRLTELPKTGGDTLWASGYEVYDRISKPVQKFLETLTATYAQPNFNKSADDNGFKIYSDERGAPENVGEKLEAVHPVVRTNPVTGWKSIFALGQHVSHINDLTKIESDALLEWFLRLVVDNHDLQVRHRWENVNDLAIWDNRSNYHVATNDYIDLGLGERAGQRAVSVGRSLTLILRVPEEEIGWKSCKQTDRIEI